ncbi:serine hydrolase domain-containing protein [Oceanicoccus sagamiensis]|uniref:Beta-lactamase-related domain-containing protein n=1 Tax=Oceanicoccus sagamiensis TaxID=716816 RepID=A0A1X9N9E5_9GAMM|nr:serine hydrolase domain-containing protein [Oceanicoccus sagamiensis]ARN73801.1 hypothetical protein BST96_06555 [Oceanicoccus sagamiensis]
MYDCITSNLQGFAEAFIEKHNIPAISIATWQDGQLQTAAAGCLNLSTGVSATTDSIFQIGSITKVMTACLVMQLVDEGRVELDAPVKQYLHDFMIADAQATESITVRQLLNHTSGMAGDYFPNDYGHEGNLIARYVDRCSLLPLVHPVGEMFSYSNAAFCVAGRLIEVVRGISWYQAMSDYLFKPLGMQHAIAHPSDVLRYRCAMGHIFDGSNTDRWVLPKKTYLTLGQAPVGSTPAMTPENLIRFARGHLEGGLNEQGERWLSADSVQQMQQSQIELPKASMIHDSHWGLGWGMGHYTNGDIWSVGHSGATNGFLSQLLMLPADNKALAFCINGCRPSAYQALNTELNRAVFNLDLTQPEPDSTSTLDKLELITGQYESMDTHITVVREQEQLKATIVYKVDPLPPLQADLRHVKDGCFAVYSAAGHRCPNMVFLKPGEQGVPQYLFNGARQNPRVANS